MSIRSGFDRPNLAFDVVSVEGKGAVARKRAALLHVLSDPAARPAIVYCGTRKDTDEVAALIAERGIATVAYHAGMAPRRERASQAAFMEDRAEVVVATNAFGMGVDKADVRTVAHWALPTSLEAYYQEAGRGGRDGGPARALLLAARMDLGRLIRFINERDTSVEDVKGYVAGLRRGSEQGAVMIRSRSAARARTGAAVDRRAGGRGRARARRARRAAGDGSPAAAARARLIRRSRPPRTAAGSPTARSSASSRASRRAGAGRSSTTSATPRRAAPSGRCCDVCDPDEELELLLRMRPGARPRVAASRARAPGERNGAAQEPVDEAQFEELRTWRWQRAEGKPAFTVAANAVLGDVLRRRPQSIEELIEIRGIGPAFCEKHGESLLEALEQLPV